MNDTCEQCGKETIDLFSPDDARGLKNVCADCLNPISYSTDPSLPKEGDEISDEVKMFDPGVFRNSDALEPQGTDGRDYKLVAYSCWIEANGIAIYIVKDGPNYVRVTAYEAGEEMGKLLEEFTVTL